MHTLPPLSVEDTAQRQYAHLVDPVARDIADVKRPAEGWIRTLRKALGMSAPQLARRLGVSKAAVYQAERQEETGGVTLHYMERMAEALGGRFVYAIVPEESVEAVLRDQARAKARHLVGRAGGHMALERQALSETQMREETDRLAADLLRDRPADFWDLP